MGLFWKKKDKKADNNVEDVIAWNIKNAQDEETRRYYEAQADKEYQTTIAEFYAILTEIKETYSVITNVASFNSEAGDRLIALCAEAIHRDDAIREKRDYYNSTKCEYCEPYKILSMTYEKREDYQRAATVCVLAIQKGYTKDGTSGGMRGRLARMIKKGNLPLSDNMKEILNI
jgi:vacuolar-type H+-ATPase catalytic subunit A/Vma1